MKGERMTRSKLKTGGIVASIIWLIIGAVWAFFSNSQEARGANILARGSCRGQEDFRACLDAYYAANGRPEIDWSGIALQLAVGLLVIWGVVFLLSLLRAKGADEPK
jgi:hypothetical protein